jgi:2-haloacid dehalogenase
MTRVIARDVNETQLDLRSPHEEVPAALALPRQTSLTVVALTNSVQRVAEAQLHNAGIDEHFDAVISADTVGALKPAAAPYRAIVARPGMVLSPLGPQPDIVGPDLAAVVEHIVQHDTSDQGET